MVSVDKFRKYLRLPPDDNEDIEGYLLAAKEKARSAGIRDFQDNAMYDQFLMQFGGLLYESRSMDTETVDPAKLQMLLNTFVLPLRYSEDNV